MYVFILIWRSSKPALPKLLVFGLCPLRPITFLVRCIYTFLLNFSLWVQMEEMLYRQIIQSFKFHFSSLRNLTLFPLSYVVSFSVFVWIIPIGFISIFKRGKKNHQLPHIFKLPLNLFFTGKLVKVVHICQGWARPTGQVQQVAYFCTACKLRILHILKKTMLRRWPISPQYF